MRAVGGVVRGAGTGLFICVPKAMRPRRAARAPPAALQLTVYSISVGFGGTCPSDVDALIVVMRRPSQTVCFTF